jgi:glutamate 5-kinase
VDDGARAALVTGKKSLLAVGVHDVRGPFEAYDVVEVVDRKGVIIAKGVSNYSSEQLRRIKGLKSDEIKSKLNANNPQEVIHRDNLVILTDE